MTRTKTFRRPALALTILAFVAGCSALKVDVDVYKGPLANEERVQMEQMAVMAIGAKPLLIELRDQLEWGDDVYHERKEATRQGWYERGFIPPAANGACLLKKEHAARVNDILSLYDDCGPRDLNEIILRIRQAFRDYERAIYVFRPPDAAEAKKAWKKIEAHVYPSLRKQSTDLESDHPAMIAGISPANVHELFEGYKLLLTTNKFDGSNPADVRIFKAHKAILDGNSGSTLLISKYPIDKIVDLGDEGDPTLEGGNSHFMALQDRGVVEAHAELLFPKGGHEAQKLKIDEARTAFVERTVEVAGAFMEAREALTRLWHDTLRLTQMINDPARTDCHGREQCNSAAAGLIVELTNSGRLVCALVCEEGALTGKGAHLRDTLKLDIPQAVIDKWTRDKRSLAKSAPGEEMLLKAALANAFAKDPAGTATGLMAIDKFVKSADTTAFENTPYTSPKKRVFGLVHGPTVFNEPDAKKGVGMLAAAFGPICSGFAGGLEAGRLPHGIETLIENYLIAADSNGRSGTATEWERLVGALVQFAEKVLFIANNQDLLSKDKNGTVERYTMVLQAVGNSILVQADELRCREKYTKNIGDSWKSEANALRNVYFSDQLMALRFMKRAFAIEMDKANRMLQESHAGASAETAKTESQKTGQPGESKSGAATPPGNDTSEKKPSGNTQNTPDNAAISENAPPAPPQEGEAPQGGSTSAANPGGEKKAEPKEANTSAKPADRPQDGTTDLAKRKKTLEATVNIIGQCINEWPLDAALDRRLSAHSTGELLLQRIKAAITSNRSLAGGTIADTEIENWREAAKEVERYVAGLPALGLISPQAKDTKAVLDELIRALQYHYIQEVGAMGKDSEVAVRTSEAIHAAYAYRSGMVYIRPPSAYLRSSYPATSLQSDPQKAWRNMLDDQVVRGIPFGIGEYWANKRETGQGRDTSRIVAEIDKQFWQNINSVRVTGAGITNYVIVKDDIGNWYVKRYAADPNPIIKSAKSLAMYNMGEKMGADLLNLPDAAKGTALTAPSGETTLQRLFRKYKTTYNEKTLAHYDELAKVMNTDGGLKTDIQKKWTAIGSTDSSLTDALKSAYDSVLAVAAMKSSDEVPEADRGGKIIDALNAIRRFHSVLQAKIADLPEGDGEGQVKKESKSAAQKSAANIVGNTLDTMVQRRQAAIKEYETAIMFIGEAAKPPQAGSAAKKPEAATDNSGT